MPVKWWGDSVYRRVRLAAMQGVVRGTESVRNEALRLVLDTTKTGREYQRRGVTHTASAPGEPPASDTGTLVRNIRTDFSRIDQLVGVVRSSAAHAEHLEYGTENMEPRPSMRPALTNKRAEIERDVRASVRAVLS